MKTRAERLREKLLNTEGKPTTSRISRLWKTGTSAASMATAVLGGRLRGRGEGLEAASLESVVRLVERLGELKGVAMKAGQILGYIDPTLSPELRELLSVLHTSASASPFSEVERAAHEALGPRSAVLVNALERVPVAVASIGQVHRGALPDGRAVAVKVLHPGIHNALEGDFKTASAGGALASTLLAGAAPTVSSFVEEAREALLEECDLELEARRQSEFARLYADDADIVIPEVLPGWSGPGLLTTRWQPGRSLEVWLESAPAQAARDRIGEALFRFYFSTLYRHGLFHADPHPGNFGIQDDGRVVVYDFGCVRRFDALTVTSFSRLATAVRSDDTAAMTDCLRTLGATNPEMSDRAREIVRGFFGPLLVPGRRAIAPDQGIEARQALQDKRAVLQLGLPGKLLFLFRLRFGLYAVLSRIGAVADWSRLESTWAAEALAPASTRRVPAAGVRDC